MHKNWMTTLKRLVMSIISQWFLFLVWLAGYIWKTFFLAQQIHNFFHITELKNKLEFSNQSVEFMKKMANLANPTAYLNYMSSLMDKMTLSTRLNMTETFANITEFIVVGLVNIGLLILLIYIFLRMVRVYRQKTIQYENVQLITRELLPKLENLKQEIQVLRTELKALNK